jgi:hypothetical protein
MAANYRHPLPLLLNSEVQDKGHSQIDSAWNLLKRAVCLFLQAVVGMSCPSWPQAISHDFWLNQRREIQRLKWRRLFCGLETWTSRQSRF